MLVAEVEKFILRFKIPARTSRGSLTEKNVYLLKVFDDTNPTVIGIGECSTLSGLSYDDKEEYETFLRIMCRNINTPIPELKRELMEWPSIRFGLECALINMKNGGREMLFDSMFTRGEWSIPINGLVWMNDTDDMFRQAEEKIAAGFRVIKLKVGALDFDSELSLIHRIRKAHPAKEIELRLDANGAFSSADALHKLKLLAKYDIHSIEQPIRQGNAAIMRDLCKRSPIPIALDEELIGHHNSEERYLLLDMIEPNYVILKPSLLGGFSACNDWIRLCRMCNVGYWITSALESNIGLNAIAQYTATLKTFEMAQGLGTGTLFENNFPTRLEISGGRLWYNPS